MKMLKKLSKLIYTHFILLQAASCLRDGRHSIRYNSQTHVPDQSATSTPHHHSPTGSPESQHHEPASTAETSTPPAPDIFKDHLLRTNTAMDKTLLVDRIIKSYDVNVFLRPPGWGKSFNLNMLKLFFELNYPNGTQDADTTRKLFTGGELVSETGERHELHPLKISEFPNMLKLYQGAAPLIFLNLSYTPARTYEEIVSEMSRKVSDLFHQHKYLQTIVHNMTLGNQKLYSDYMSRRPLHPFFIERGVRILSKYMFLYFDIPVHIFIDDYDSPINSAYLNFGHNETAFQNVVNLFFSLYSHTFKDSTYLNRGILTGVLPLHFTSVNLTTYFSQFASVKEHTALDEPFHEFFGLNEKEVTALVETLGQRASSNMLKSLAYNYNGRTMYSTKSIIQIMTHKRLPRHYWMDPDNPASFDKFIHQTLLANNAIQKDIDKLLVHGELSAKIDISLPQLRTNKDMFYSLLVYLGYLNANLTDYHNNVYKLRIPNEQLKEFYVSCATEWISAKIPNYNILLQSLTTGNIEKFADTLQEYVRSPKNHFNLRSKLDFHTSMSSILTPLRSNFRIVSKTEAGNEYLHVLIPLVNLKNITAFVLAYTEMKRDDTWSIDRVLGNDENILVNKYDGTIERYSNVAHVMRIVIAIDYERKYLSVKFRLDKTPPRIYTFGQRVKKFGQRILKKFTGA